MPAKTWNGSNADWYTAADWSGGTLPTASDDVVLPSGVVALSKGDAGIAVASVTLAGGSLQIRDTSQTHKVSGNFTITTGTLDVDVVGGNFDGGSSLTIGGTLSNTGTVGIGNNQLSAPTTVTVAALVNSGTLGLQGDATLGTTKQATLAVAGAAPAILTAAWYVGGDADLEFGSGGIGGIASTGSLVMVGAQARISLGANTSSTALAGLSSNAGFFQLRGDLAIGNGGAAVTTATDFSNTGTLDVDVVGGNFDGGSSLTIGGTLSNTGTVGIGNNQLSAPTTVTVAALVNSGTLGLQGDATLGTTKQATLAVAGAAPAILTAAWYVGGDADLEFGSGGIGGIASTGSLVMVGAQARISLGANTSSTALAGLSSNAGFFQLRGDLAIGNGGAAVTTATDFSNTGTLDVDVVGGNFDGGSSLTIGGTLSNSGIVSIGNNQLSAPTTVTASGLVNSKSINISSKPGGVRATLSIIGPGRPGVAAGVNTGTITSNADGVAVNGAARLVNGSSGSPAGLISAGYTGVVLGGGGTLVNFGTITGANGTAVAFGSGAGTVVIEPGAVFTGVLGGFAKSDIIDFAHVTATGFGFAGGALTLFNHGTAVGAVSVTGSFKSADLALAADGNGGVEIGIGLLGPVITGTYYTSVLLSDPAINNSATVTGTGRIAPAYGDAVVGGAGVAGTVTNFGTITATSSSSVGVKLSGGGLVTNSAVGSAGGYISGAASGVLIGGGIGTITNSGTIKGGSGVVIANSSIATVSNSGMIAGTAGTAVSLGGGNNRLILAPGAVLQGKADGGGGKSVVEVAASASPGGLGAAGTEDGSAATVYVNLGSVTNFSALQVDPSAALDAGGALSFDTLVNQGRINLAAGDSLAVGNVASAAGAGTIDLKSGGMVHFTGAVAANQTVLFRPPGGTAVLDHPEQFAGMMTEFAATDVVDLPLGQAVFQQYSGGVLSLSYGGGSVALHLSTLYATPKFQFTDDGHGGTDIFASDSVCFCRGTRVLTERGEVAVEALAVGDRVRTLSGALKPIVWIGLGRDLVTRRNRLARPIIVRRGALADGVPRRDLYLTHGHALYIDSAAGGVLIPVEHLVNHRSILWDETARVVEYYHIELEDHDVLLAEGAPAESFYDAGNRISFHNARPGSTAGKARPTFAPVLTAGEIVETAWARLFARARGEIEQDVTDDADIHLVVDGERIEPEMSGHGAYRFAVARSPAARLLLRSRCGVPSLMGQGRCDHRRLGVAITQLVLDHAGIATYFDYDQPQLREGGCYEHEDGFCWTDGEFTLPARFFTPLPGGFTLVVHTEPHPDMRYPIAARRALAA